MFRLTTAVLMLSLCSSAFAQSYITAAGLRMGGSWGVSIQQRVFERITGELNWAQSPGNPGNTFFLIGKIHNSLFTKSANFFWGGGIHRYKTFDNDLVVRSKGITGTVGAELTLGRINLSWDYRMMFDRGTLSLPFSSETAISLRYVLIKKLTRKQKKKLFGDQKKKKARQSRSNNQKSRRR